MERNININRDRMWERLNILGDIGRDPKGGISRFAWEPAYKNAMRQLIEWSESDGLTVRIDTVGNVFARLEGNDRNAPAVLSGSHLDTVPRGGLFDGTAGVVGALEALVSIKESGRSHERPIEMVAFINEEASQFYGGTFGSKALCAMLPGDYAFNLKHRWKDQYLSDAMKEFGMGLDPTDLEGSIINPEKYYAFIEMHIEQGRYLLDHGLSVANVKAIAGIKQFYITICGDAAHAGGMAMRDRHDAMAAAAAIASEVERIAKETKRDTRGTVGYIESYPGEHNIIAGKCIVPVDFREADIKEWQRVYDRLIEFTKDQCEKRGLTWSVKSTCDLKPAVCASKLVNVIDSTAEVLGIRCGSMISFPAHDAINMSRIMPIGMIFLRSSNGGVSHCPEEFTTKEDLTKGTQILTNTLYRISTEKIF